MQTFFSTDVVKYQNQNQNSGNSTQDNQGTSNGSFSSIALQRWIEVTVPLTALTLLVAWSSLRIAERKKEGIEYVRRKHRKISSQVTKSKAGMTLPLFNSSSPKKSG